MASIEAKASHVFTSGKDSRPPELRGPQEFAEPKPVVRVFAVAPIPVEEFLENLKRGYTPFFSEVIISQKSHVSKPSPDNLTAVGGAIEPGESVVEAGLAEFAEEATGYTMNIDGFKQYWMQGEKQKLRIQPYIYRPPGEKYQEGHKAYLTVVPFVSRSFALYEVREGRHGASDKMKHMLQFSPEQLAELFEKGSIQLSGGPTRIVGHLTKVPSEITITPRQARKRNKALDQVLKEVRRFEHLLREETLAQINRIRVWKHQPPVSSLEGCSRSETVTGFVAAQMRLGLYDERLRELTGKQSPPPKKDLLKFIQYVIGVDSEQLADLLLARPSREVLHGTNLLKRAMRRAIIELYPPEQRQELQTLIRLSDLRRSLPGYIWRPLRKIMEKVTGRRWSGLEAVNLYRALSDIWPQVLAMPLPLRVEAFIRANKRLVAEIARMQGTAKSDVYDALRAAEDTSEHINQSMRGEFIIKSLRGEKEHPIYFQDHRPLDEVANAKLFTLAVMALGFHPNLALNPVDRYKIQQTLKFESWRVLSAFLAGLDRIPSKVKYADNSLFEGAIDSFFHWPPEMEIIDLGDGVLHPVYHYRSKMVFNGSEIHLIKDERTRKTEARVEIKAFQSANLHDVYSTNLVIADDNFPNATPDQLELRLELADKVREALLAHVRGQVESHGWKVSFLAGTHDQKSYERLRTVLNLPADQREAYMATLSGDRPGSKGDLIIRDKFNLHWERDGEAFTNEVCIYPFEHMDCDMALELKECGFWGFKEKLRDDAIGDYSTTRLYARDAKRPTDPSVYELYHPGPLYESLTVRMMRRQMKKRRRSRSG